VEPSPQNSQNPLFTLLFKPDLEQHISSRKPKEKVLLILVIIIMGSVSDICVIRVI